MLRSVPMSSKLDALSATLTGYGRVVVAFSGGVDSAFLLKVAVDALGAACHAVTAVSPTMARSEIKGSIELAAALGLGARHHIIDSHELEVPGFTDNPTHRCAMCKTELMDVALPIARSLGDAPVVLGTNTDDLGDVRPGIAAARERGARMPMVEVGLSKAEIRELSKQLALPTWNKPQLACLSSRFPYGTKITPDRLLGIISNVPEAFPHDPRPKQLEWMIRQAKSIAGQVLRIARHLILVMPVTRAPARVAAAVA